MKQKPLAIKADQWTATEDKLSPGCTYVSLHEGQHLDVGLYFIPPGHQTNLFSLEDHDDQQATEWYGPSDEIYYVLAGDELTMYWGEDAEAVKNGNSESIKLSPGDLGYWTRGWKYSVKNTGNAPATFFWGLSIPEQLENRRELTNS